MREFGFKIIILGKEQVGKTSLIEAAVMNKQVESGKYKTTIGVNFMIYPSKGSIDVDGNKVQLNLWDVAGQERQARRLVHYTRASHLALIVISSQEFFPTFNEAHLLEQMRTYLPEAEQTFPNSRERLPLLLVISKTDLLPEGAFNEAFKARLQAFCKKEGFIDFCLTSSKTLKGVKEAMDTAARICLKYVSNVTILGRGLTLTSADAESLTSILTRSSGSSGHPVSSGRIVIPRSGRYTMKEGIIQQFRFELDASMPMFIADETSNLSSVIDTRDIDCLVIPITPTTIYEHLAKLKIMGDQLSRERLFIYGTSTPLIIVLALMDVEPSSLPPALKRPIFISVTVKSPQDLLRCIVQRYYDVRVRSEEEEDEEIVDVDEPPEPPTPEESHCCHKNG